jgi:hypothetical protein
MSGRRVCRHCARCAATRPRGLCWACFNDPAVRVLYPTHPTLGRTGVGLSSARSRELPAEPTAAPPGTDDKMAVLEQRAAEGVCLWHPADARCADE